MKVCDLRGLLARLPKSWDNLSVVMDAEGVLREFTAVEIVSTDRDDKKVNAMKLLAAGVESLELAEVRPVEGEKPVDENPSDGDDR